MKVGDLIQFRKGWTNHKTSKKPVYPRTDDDGWSAPCLVLQEWEQMWVIFHKGRQILLSECPNLTEVRVLNEAKQ